MACRCQERREAIRRAKEAKTAQETMKAVRFVARTMAEDAARALKERRK